MFILCQIKFKRRIPHQLPTSPQNCILNGYALIQFLKLTENSANTYLKIDLALCLVSRKLSY